MAVAERIRDFIRPRYDVPQMMHLLGVSRYRAELILAGHPDFAEFYMLFERIGLSFVVNALGISNANLATGGLVSLLRRHEEETRRMWMALDQAAAAAPSVPEPEIVERDWTMHPPKLGTAMSRWLARWQVSPRLELSQATKLVAGDASGRVGLMSRSRTATAFTCRHIGRTLHFNNTGGMRLVGSTTADWGNNPYLMSCAEAYRVAADGGRPLLQEVRIGEGQGLLPNEPAFLRLLLPFENRAKTTLVIVISEPLITSHGSSR